MESPNNENVEMATSPTPATALGSYYIEAPYTASRRRSTAKCKVCRQRLEAGDLRVVNMVKNPFDKTGASLMRVCHHLKCLFKRFKGSKPTTEKVTHETNLNGFEELDERDKALVREEIESLNASLRDPARKNKRKANEGEEKAPKKAKKTKELAYDAIQIRRASVDDMDDEMTFEEFCDLCDTIAAETNSSGKSKIVAEALTAGGDALPIDNVCLIVRMLLPKCSGRVHNMSPKRIIKLFAEIFGSDVEEMTAELKRSGDVSMVVAKCASPSLTSVERPAYLREVEWFIEALNDSTKESEQLLLLKKQINTCFTTEKQVMYFVRLINGDLRTKAGEKHVLAGVSMVKKEKKNYGATAFESFCVNGDMNEAVKIAMSLPPEGFTPSPKLFKPVVPMLADACKSVDAAFKKAKTKDEANMFAEVKYDGERVQIHADFEVGRFAFFSRNLKEMPSHKVGGEDMKEDLRRAFPEAKTIILESEALLVSNDTGEILQLGDSGKSKEGLEGKAHTRLYVFDLLLYNGRNLINTPFSERRALLEEKLVADIPRVTVTKLDKIEGEGHLLDLINGVLKENQEGLMVKNGSGVYAPGKRHWLKIKKNSGAMADTVDLAVMGAWYGSGKKSGLLSVFLMCSLDKETGEWKTVTKVHAGLDDNALERIQEDLKKYMVETKDGVATKGIRSALKPDWVADNASDAKIWEIGGAQFFKAEGKDIDGVSIRLPRVVRERPDKNWETVTSIAELEELYKNSVGRVANSSGNDSTSTDSSDSEREERM